MTDDLDIRRYSLGKPLARSGPACVYRGTRLADGRTVLVKRFEPGPRSVFLARREFKALQDCAHTTIPQALEIDISQEHPLLVMDDVPGIPLQRWVDDALPSLGAFLQIGRQVADALAHMHGARYLHRDLTPRSIVVHPGTLTAHVAGMGWALPIGSRVEEDGHPPGALPFGRTLLYAAPEQTGRMNRPCDFRTDLYSLGATLYFALTGHPPFEYDDALVLIHAHMARLPSCPSDLRPEVPLVLCDLVLRLLRKEPDERYQTAAGLAADLGGLSRALASFGSLDESCLSYSEAPERPSFGRRLFGREDELSRLEESYGRAAVGEIRWVRLVGPAGVGKTSLVDALRRRLTGTSAYVVEGHFEKSGENPRSGWRSALQALACQILVESDSRLEAWRSDLLDGMGRLAGALTRFVPDLTFVLGEPPEQDSSLGSAQTQARLLLGLQRFLASAATTEHPIVVFLDDFQWSDSDSQAMLRAALAVDAASLLIITAYRCESSENAPFRTLIEELARGRHSVETIELGPIGIYPASLMLSEALGGSLEELQPLALLFQRRTGNVPLLIEQTIEQAHSHGLLAYEHGRWVPDLEGVASLDALEGALDWMTGKIERLEPGQRALLLFASCIQGEFDAESLVDLECGSLERVGELLDGLLDAGLVVPCNSGGLRCAHERVRDAASALLPAEERSRIHLHMGNLLLARSPDPEGTDLFQIADHLNACTPLLHEQLRVRLIELDVKSGRIHLASGSAARARSFLEAAFGIFVERDWESHRALGFALYSLLADSLFQTGELDRTLRVLDSLEKQSLDELEFGQVAAKRVAVLALRSSPLAGMQYALRAIATLGVRWPVHPSRLRASLAMLLARRRLRRRLASGQKLFIPAQAMPRRILAVLMISYASGPLRARVDSLQSTVSLAYALRMFLRYGYVGSPAYLLSAYSLYVQSVLADVNGCRHSCELAQTLNPLGPNEIASLRTEYQLKAFALPWFKRRRAVLAQLACVSERLLELGDPEYAYYASFVGASLSALAGEPVALATDRLRKLAQTVEQGGQWYREPAHCYVAYSLLLRESIGAEILDQKAAEIDSLIKATEVTGMYTRSLFMLALCVYRRPDLARAQSDALDRPLARNGAGVLLADHLLLRGLASADLAAGCVGRARRRYRRDLARCRRRLSRLGRGGPDFAHMCLMLQADERSLIGQGAHADGFYQKAARGAKAQEYIHHAAMAQERRGRLLMTQGRELAAQLALDDALALYEKWGARAKVAQLANELHHRRKP